MKGSCADGSSVLLSIHKGLSKYPYHNWLIDAHVKLLFDELQGQRSTWELYRECVEECWHALGLDVRVGFYSKRVCGITKALGLEVREVRYVDPLVWDMIRALPGVLNLSQELWCGAHKDVCRFMLRVDSAQHWPGKYFTEV